MSLNLIQKFKKALVELEIATPDEIRGCGEKEISAIEKQFNFRFPLSYREFLLHLGREAGRLFAWDSVDVYVPDIIASNESKEAYGLPKGSFMILDRMGEQGLYILSQNGEDCPVYKWCEWEAADKQAYGSILDWLTDWSNGAQEAIASGYFD